MAKTIAKVSGVALTPGVSRNGRMYTREAIAGAVRRAQQRIETGRHPIGMYTHHDTASVADLAGRVSRVWQDEDGAARFTADIADTPAGRAIAALADGSDGREPFVRGVSIRGNWVGGTHRERAPDGTLAEVGSDLEIGRLDWTGEPGVEAAGVDEFRLVTAESAGRGYRICESAPEVRVKAGKAVRKAAKRAAREAAVRRQVTEDLAARGVRVAESMTAAQAPALQAGAAVPVTVPEPATPLHEMDSDEFRAHALDAFSAYGRSRGFASPSWQ